MTTSALYREPPALECKAHRHLLHAHFSSLADRKDRRMAAAA